MIENLRACCTLYIVHIQSASHVPVQKSTLKHTHTHRETHFHTQQICHVTIFLPSVYEWLGCWFVPDIVVVVFVTRLVLFFRHCRVCSCPVSPVIRSFQFNSMQFFKWLVWNSETETKSNSKTLDMNPTQSRAFFVLFVYFSFVSYTVFLYSCSANDDADDDETQEAATEREKNPL